MKHKTIFLIIGTIFLCSCGRSYRDTGIKSYAADENGAPFMYEEYLSLGGRIEPIQPNIQQKRPVYAGDYVEMRIKNRHQKSLCFFGIKNYSQEGKYRIIPAAAINQRNKKLYEYPLQCTSVDYGTYPLSLEEAVIVRPNEEILIQLETNYDFPLVIKGKYTAYFHVFTPFCESIKGKSGEIKAPYAQMPLKGSSSSIYPNLFDVMDIGEIDSMQGVYFTSKLSMRIK